MEHLLVRVISLADSLDRRASFERANPGGLDWRYLDGKRGIEHPLRYDPARAMSIGGRPLTPGELGCYASHYAAWAELAAHPTATHSVVFEDDVVIDWPFFVDFAAAAAAGKASGLIRFFTALAPTPANVRHGFVGRYALLESRTTAFGMAAYAIDRPTAAILLQALAEVLEPVDFAIDAYWRHGVRSKIVFPFPVFHRHAGTEIENERFGEERKTLAQKVSRARRRLSDVVGQAFWDLRHG